MTKNELHQIYVKHAKNDFKVNNKKSFFHGSMLTGMRRDELVKVGVTKAEIKRAVKKGWALEQHFNEKGQKSICIAYLWTQEMPTQRGWRGVLEKIVEFFMKFRF